MHSLQDDESPRAMGGNARQCCLTTPLRRPDRDSAIVVFGSSTRPQLLSSYVGNTNIKRNQRKKQIGLNVKLLMNVFEHSFLLLTFYNVVWNMQLLSAKLVWLLTSMGVHWLGYQTLMCMESEDKMFGEDLQDSHQWIEAPLR